MRCRGEASGRLTSWRGRRADVWLTGDVGGLIRPAIDFYADTGELTLPLNVVGLWFSEMDIVYTAGLATIPDPVKVACAQIVRNAQATPALNVKPGTLDRMHLQYFSDTLVDDTVRVAAGAVRGAESGMTWTHGSAMGVSGTAVVRAADAMLRSLGGAEVSLLFPLSAMPNDPSVQLGLVDPGVEEVKFSPVVVRNLPTQNTGPRRRLEFLLSASRWRRRSATGAWRLGMPLLERALGVMRPGRSVSHRGVVTECFAGRRICIG